MGRGVRYAALIALILVLSFNYVPGVMAESRSETAPLSWDDVTPVAHYRNQGDWLVDTGEAKASDIYGPFPGKEYHEGDTERFFALDFDSQDAPRRIVAVLRLITDHAYWWFEQGTNVDQNAIVEAGKRFETQIYPLDHKLFGDEWNPGIDGDPHVFILHQATIGSYAVGVFSPKDECPRSLCQDSNQHEMIYVGLDYGPPNSDQQLTVIAHEFQHLIEYNTDGGEERWLNEGLSQLAEHLNGFSPRNIASTNLSDFLSDPNFQLNTWPSTIDQDPAINYAVSYIFCVYLYQRFGTPFIEHLARSPYKGLASIEESLKALNISEDLDQVFADWAVTNYVNLPYTGDGRYYYQSLKLPQRARTITVQANTTRQGDVNEYGAEYLQLSGDATYNLTFTGDTTVPLLNIPPTSGQWMWWSFNEEHGASRMERDFDLTNTSGKVTLTYNALWQMSTTFSSADVLVSVDGGQTWKPLKASGMQRCRFFGAPSCYMHSVDTWQNESIDLSDYAGQKIRLRFEYLSDTAPLDSGIFIDDIAIPAIHYLDNAETDGGGWTTHGFMRATSNLPQHWAVNVIQRSGPPTVQPIALDDNNTGTLQITAPSDGAVVVVSAMAPFVQSQAHYSLAIK